MTDIPYKEYRTMTAIATTLAKVTKKVLASTEPNFANSETILGLPGSVSLGSCTSALSSVSCCRSG